VQPHSVASTSAEDELADAAVWRGRRAGAPWIVASVIAFGLGLVARSAGAFSVAWLTGLALFAIGIMVRRRFWRSARRRLGDATIQRARWRSAESDRNGPERLVAAVVLVLLLLGVQLWTR
jgi:hypothetical protein